MLLCIHAPCYVHIISWLALSYTRRYKLCRRYKHDESILLPGNGRNKIWKKVKQDTERTDVEHTTHTAHTVSWCLIYQPRRWEFSILTFICWSCGCGYKHRNCQFIFFNFNQNKLNEIEYLNWVNFQSSTSTAAQRVHRQGVQCSCACAQWFYGLNVCNFSFADSSACFTHSNFVASYTQLHTVCETSSVYKQFRFAFVCSATRTTTQYTP